MPVSIIGPNGKPVRSRGLAPIEEARDLGPDGEKTTREELERRKQRIQLMREAADLTPKEILSRISAIEGVDAPDERKLKPTFAGTEGADFHIHQFGEEVRRGATFVFGEEQAKAFWQRLEGTPIHDAAVLTHSNIRVREPEIDADAVYETLMQHKPSRLFDRHLWRGMEVKTYSQRRGTDGERAYTGEIGVLSLDPKRRFDPWFYEQHTLHEVCERVKADPNLVGFVTHPNAPDGVATGLAKEEAPRLMSEGGLSKKEAEKRVQESQFGERKAAEIMEEYGLGTEYHGFYKETLDAAETGHAVFSRTPLVGGAISKVTGRAVKIIERMYDVSDYEQAAAFMTVGSDAHRREHIGGSYLIVNAPERKLGGGESVGRVYDATELESGLVVLTAREERRNRALVEALTDPDVEKIAVLSEPPQEKTLGEFMRRLSRLIDERKAQLSEARVTRLGEEQMISDATKNVDISFRTAPTDTVKHRSITHLYPIQRRVLEDILSQRYSIEGVSSPQALRVLDAGCGIGTLPYALQKEGVTAYGIDIDPECIKRGLHEGVKNLRTADMSKLPFDDGFFDVVTMTAATDYGIDEKAVEEIRRVTKPGGLLMAGISVPADLETVRNRGFEVLYPSGEEDLGSQHYFVLRKTAVA